MVRFTKHQGQEGSGPRARVGTARSRNDGHDGYLAMVKVHGETIWPDTERHCNRGGKMECRIWLQLSGGHVRSTRAKTAKRLTMWQPCGPKELRESPWLNM